jgi:hypothetical protein
MFEAEQLRKHALECLRLQADCMELAAVAHCRNMQSHFVFMAKFWVNLAVSGPSSNAGPKNLKTENKHHDRRITTRCSDRGT